jgi:tellurite resistance protein TehA-like permease
VVASQSIAVLSAVLQPQMDWAGRQLSLLAVFCWSVGAFLYAAAGILITVRMLVYPVSAPELTPSYWIAMGATAITVFAGARIVQMTDAPMVAATRGLIAGTSVLFWCFGTWLIPALIAAGAWRHLIQRVPLYYDTALWSIVFPLGMYWVGGYYLGLADHLPYLTIISSAEGWIALAAWAATFLALVVHLGRGLLRPRA